MTNIRQAPGTLLYWSGRPDPNTIKNQLLPLNIKTIISLDRESSVELRKELNNHPELLEKVQFIDNDIRPNSPSDGGMRLRNLFLNNIPKPVYVHCRQGQDRCGFAIGLWGMLKEPFYPQVDAQYATWPKPCKMIKYLENLTGYGKGLTPMAKQQLNQIIGCAKEPDVIIDEDTLEADDIVGKMREEYDYFRGNTSDGGWEADNPRFNLSVEPDAENALGKSTKARKRILRAILKMAEKNKKEEEEEEEDKEDTNDMVDVGIVDNYQGICQFMNQPSGAPGAPNAAGPVMPAGPNVMG